MDTPTLARQCGFATLLVPPRGAGWAQPGPGGAHEQGLAQHLRRRIDEADGVVKSVVRGGEACETMRDRFTAVPGAQSAIRPGCWRAPRAFSP
jgi:hypothetical protein